MPTFHCIVHCNSVKPRPAVFFSFTLFSGQPDFQLQGLFNILLQFSDCACCVQHYPLVIKGKKSNKTEVQNFWHGFKVLVLSKFGHMNKFFDTRFQKSWRQVQGWCHCTSLVLAHRIQGKDGNSYLQFNKVLSSPSHLTLIMHICLCGQNS